MKARIHVTLKPSVLDPQGQAVAHALVRMGNAGVKGARIGKYIELELDGEPTEAEVDQMCRKLLANTVIEDYRFEILA